MQGINIHWFGLGVKFDSYCIVGFGDNQFKGGEFKDFAHSYKGDLEKKDQESCYAIRIFNRAHRRNWWNHVLYGSNNAGWVVALCRKPSFGKQSYIEQGVNYDYIIEDQALSFSREWF